MSISNKNATKITPIIGLQWGDEGKGKGVARIASRLSRHDLIVRFQGGNNAGHTIWHKSKCYVFHLIPSGVFGKARIHLGAGMVINPVALEEEAAMIPRGTSYENRTSISPDAVLTLPTHILLDSVSERKMGKKKIGSTGKGISPSYTDLVLRRALRVGDIFQKNFRKKYMELRKEHEKTLYSTFGYRPNQKELRGNEAKFFKSLKFLKSFRIAESAGLVLETLASSHRVIAEGAQGALLDVRFGNYPFVTSSHTISAGVGTGLGIAPGHIGEAIGVLKAYTTRVGEGPFPTELGGQKSAQWCRDKKYAYEKSVYPTPSAESTDEFEQGVALRRLGSELGATTGRLRRTGWLDIPLVRYAMEMNGVTSLILTKLDVFDGFKKIKVCTSYVIDGRRLRKEARLPSDLATARISCIYKSFPIWKGKLSDYGGKLPKEALDYIKFLEKTLGARIIYVGTGPEEHHVIERYWR